MDIDFKEIAFEESAMGKQLNELSKLRDDLDKQRADSIAKTEARKELAYRLLIWFEK